METSMVLVKYPQMNNEPHDTTITGGFQKIILNILSDLKYFRYFTDAAWLFEEAHLWAFEEKSVPDVEVCVHWEGVNKQTKEPGLDGNIIKM